MSSWLSPNTAPKDQTIIADFGYPWAVMAIWSEAQQQWAITELEWSMFEGAGDPGFVTEWQDDCDLKGWCALPSVCTQLINKNAHV